MTKRKRNKTKTGRPVGYVTSEETKQKQRVAQLAYQARKRQEKAAEYRMTSVASITVHGSTTNIEDSYDPSKRVRQIVNARTREAREIRVSESPRTAMSTFNDVNYKNFVNLTLQKIRGIMNSTQSSLGDLQSASEYADTMYLEDAHLRSVLDSHISSIVGKPLVIDDAGENPDDQRAVELIRLCMKNVKNLNGTLRSLTFAHWSGQSFAEIQWASVSITEGNKEMILRKPYKLKPIHAKKWRIQLVPQPGSDIGEGDFKYTLYDQGRFFESTNGTSGYIGVDVDKTYPNTFIKHSPEGNIPIHKRGLWRAAAFKFFQKKAMEQFMDAGAERYAWPFVYAVGPQDMSDESMDSVLNGLDSISQNVNAVFEQGTEIHSLSISSPQGAADLFNSRIDQINAAYSKLILGSTLVVEEGDSGSRALAETQEGSKIDRSSLEAAQLCETLREQLFRPILEENAHLFVDGAPNIPTCKFSLSQDTQEPITPDVQQYFRVNEIRTSRGYEPIEGPEGERFGGPQALSAGPNDQEDI